MKIPQGIVTHSGKVIDPKNINPDDIVIEDIAWGLSKADRWGGQSREFYSVAQHSVQCARMSSGQDKLSALMHDASEAYLCDIPSPIKALLPDYHELEKKFMQVIADKFEFQFPMSSDVKSVDKLMAHIEYGDLMTGETEYLVTRGHTQQEAYDLFMKVYEEVQFSTL